MRDVRDYTSHREMAFVFIGSMFHHCYRPAIVETSRGLGDSNTRAPDVGR